MIRLVNNFELQYDMTVGEISNEAVTVPVDGSVIETAELMQRESIGALVVEDDETVEGIVTDREIVLAVTDHEGDLSDVTVEAVMTEEPQTLRADDESLNAARTMAETGVRRIIVVDDTDSVIGLVSLDDIVALTGEQLADIATVIEKQSPGYKP
jgi:CBS domain-containing protein